MKALSRFYIGLILFFLYAPIAVMIVFSFNSAESVWVFEGFSLDWYRGLATNNEMLEALIRTLIIAVLSALISTVMGTAAAVGINVFKNKKGVGAFSNDELVAMILFLNSKIISKNKEFKSSIICVLIAMIDFL